MKFCVSDSVGDVLRKYIDLLSDTFWEAGTSLFWEKKRKSYMVCLKSKCTDFPMEELEM
jgi:hypothetical protein